MIKLNRKGHRCAVVTDGGFKNITRHAATSKWQALGRAGGWALAEGGGEESGRHCRSVGFCWGKTPLRNWSQSYLNPFFCSSQKVAENWKLIMNSYELVLFMNQRPGSYWCVVQPWTMNWNEPQKCCFCPFLEINNTLINNGMTWLSWTPAKREKLDGSYWDIKKKEKVEEKEKV